MAKRGRRRREDPILDVVLNRLSVMDRNGELDPSELSAELEGLAIYRGISKSTIWERWKAVRHPDYSKSIFIIGR